MRKSGPANTRPTRPGGGRPRGRRARAAHRLTGTAHWPAPHSRSALSPRGRLAPARCVWRGLVPVHVLGSARGCRAGRGGGRGVLCWEEPMLSAGVSTPMTSHVTTPYYSPALGCDAALDGWCAANCPVPADGSQLVARQTSTSAYFLCYSSGVLHDLDSITFATSSTPPKMCARKSTAEYVRAYKMMAEPVELGEALNRCLRNASLSATATSSRRAQIAALHKPFLRARPLHGTGDPALDGTSVGAAARAWLGAAVLDPSARERCIASGVGKWSNTAHDGAVEPYLLSSDYLPRANVSRWWWGVCDEDLRHGAVRPPRAAVLQVWVPNGDGCDSLKKGRAHLPSLRTLGQAFCARHAGRTVLFVGDSVQGQFFTSFVSALGVWHSEHQMRQPLRKCAKDRRWMNDLAAIHEFNLDMNLCSPDPTKTVRARFIRNELLWLDSAVGGGEHVPRNFVMCDWRAEAVEADLLVLNRGMHFMNDSIVLSQLGATFGTLLHRRRSTHRRRPASDVAHTDRDGDDMPRIVYRGIHAPIPACHVLDDPLPRPFPYTAYDASVRAFHWGEFGTQNAKVALLARERNITFMDVHTQTAQRPGGHMPSRKGTTGDCAHYCIPGPLDEWVRLLLALWT